ncbi:MAG: hypothetical protein LKJ90_08125 [Faecalibacterium sp.]|jgi:hypothetical protein|nr:hypothetical protein [Faecalibacterium sp.]
MPKYVFPFPDRELAGQELSYDPCYPKIPVEDRPRIAADAWQKGAAAAQEVLAAFAGSYDFFAICGQSGLKIVEREIDYVVGRQRYFSDYVSGKSTVTLYTRSIALWAEKNGMSLRDAENVILSHEYFHFLEWTKLGLTSRDYQVPMLNLGRLKLGKTGIRALSEIGAHGFARTYYDLHQNKEDAK